jgi:hypothetical protein
MSGSSAKKYFEQVQDYEKNKPKQVCPFLGNGKRK